MKKLYDDIKLIQKEALEKEVESWVTESLEKYEYYGEGEIGSWAHDYVYGRTMNEALAAQVGLRTMTRHRKENRSSTKKELHPDDKKRLHIDHIRRQTHQRQIVDEGLYKGPMQIPYKREDIENMSVAQMRKIAASHVLMTPHNANKRDLQRILHSNHASLYHKNVQEVSEGMRGRVMGAQGAFGKGNEKPAVGKTAAWMEPKHAKLEPHREGPYAVGWRGQSWEWYGDGEPGKGPGRYKPKGDGGRFTHINIPTHAQAVDIAKKVDQDYHDKKFHEAEGVYRKHGDAHYVEYHGSVVTPHKEMDDYDKDNLSHQQKGHERWRAKDMSAKPTRSFKSLKENIESQPRLTRDTLMRTHGWEWSKEGKQYVHRQKGALVKTSKGWIHDMTPASAGGAYERTAHAGSNDADMVKYVKGLGK